MTTEKPPSNQSNQLERSLSNYFKAFPVLPEIADRIDSITENIIQKVSTKKIIFSEVMNDNIIFD